MISARTLDLNHADHPELKVVFMSGYTDDVIERAQVMKGRQAFIQKPFGRHELLHTIRVVLDGSPTGSAIPEAVARGGRVTAPL